MTVRRRNVLLLGTLAAAVAAATPIRGQTAVLAVGSANSGTQGAASIPDFSGIWGHPYLPGFEPPPTGPGPVVNKSRRRQIIGADGRRLPAADAPLVSDPNDLVGDYANPILKPEAAAIVKKYAEMS